MTPKELKNQVASHKDHDKLDSYMKMCHEPQD